MNLDRLRAARYCVTPFSTLGGYVADPSRDVLLDLVDEAFDRRAWHGPTLYRSVRGVTSAQAVWRPAPGGHNIWEVLLHAAYWKHQVRRRLSRALGRGDGRARNGSFPI